MTELIAPIMAVVVAVGGAWWVQRASGAREITRATKVLIEPLTERIDTLYQDIEIHEGKILQQSEKIRQHEARIFSQAQEIEKLKAERMRNNRRLAKIEKWAGLLRDQVIELGGSPVTLDDT